MSRIQKLNSPLVAAHLFSSEKSAQTFPQVDCENGAPDFDIIMMECSSEFNAINFYFGGKDYALTVSVTLTYSAKL